MNTKIFFQQELAKLRTLADLAGDYGRCVNLGSVPCKGLPTDLPLLSFRFGPEDPSAPLLAIMGGVHGLEFVGAQIASSLLESYIHLLHWDDSIREVMSKLRMVFVPMVNPWGLYMGKRANAQGIDLMRNAPIEALSTSHIPLLSGHRLSSSLPWYRGPRRQRKNTSPNGSSLEEELQGMALENQLLSQFLLEESKGRPFVLSVDIHSGFGISDRLWFPYAYSKKPFQHLAEVYRFKELIDDALPNHVYTIEPQSKHYTTHGDLWDYLFFKFSQRGPGSMYIPFSLEIGSWRWVRKNPWQIFSFFGMFNPIKSHRLKRALRRHLPFFDFMTRATLSWKNWALSSSPREKAKSENAAMRLWHGNGRRKPH